MTNGKVLTVVSVSSLKAIKKLEEMEILVKEDSLDENIRRVVLDKLFEHSAEGYRGGLEAIMISILHGYIRDKNLLIDPYVTIESTGKEEPKIEYPGCGRVTRKPDEKIEVCPKCGGSNVSNTPNHIWVKSGLYRYETGRMVSCCYDCWWGNRREIQAEEQARIDSGDLTEWGTRI